MLLQAQALVNVSSAPGQPVLTQGKGAAALSPYPTLLFC